MDHYKEIALANNIPPPYVIRVGQQLRLKDAKQLAAANAAKEPADTGVVVTPLNTDGAVSEPAAPHSAPPTVTSPMVNSVSGSATAP